jgi:dTDP-4-dehydrorhamnose reductase
MHGVAMGYACRMRVLIVGASGFVGSALRAVFGSEAVGTYCNHPVDALVQLDIRDADAVRRLVSDVDPQLIIHPAAQPHVDWCEDHERESYDVNVAGTRNVAAAAYSAGARYVFFSSDYVFDGRDGPYREDAVPNPPNVYGRHKLDAEQAIAATLQDYLIVRVCGVYGFERAGKNFVMALLARGQRGEAMNVPSDQWNNPTYADNLAVAVKELALGSHRGILHVVGPEYIDRISFARLACEVFGVDSGFLRPKVTAELGQRAPRPLRGGLDSAKARALLTCALVAPREGLEQMKLRLRGVQGSVLSVQGSGGR